MVWLAHRYDSMGCAYHMINEINEAFLSIGRNAVDPGGVEEMSASIRMSDNEAGRLISMIKEIMNRDDDYPDALRECEAAIYEAYKNEKSSRLANETFDGLSPRLHQAAWVLVGVDSQTHEAGDVYLTKTLRDALIQCLEIDGAALEYVLTSLHSTDADLSEDEEADLGVVVDTYERIAPGSLQDALASVFGWFIKKS